MSNDSFDDEARELREEPRKDIACLLTTASFEKRHLLQALAAILLIDDTADMSTRRSRRRRIY